MIVLAAYFAAMFGLTALLVWRAAQRWWDYLAIAALTVPLLPFVARYIAGDMGHYFPDGTFSDGAQGKDEIIVVSAASTVIFAVMGAACIVWAANTPWRAVGARRTIADN